MQAGPRGELNREQKLLSVDAFALRGSMAVLKVNVGEVSVTLCQRQVFVPMHIRFAPVPRGVVRKLMMRIVRMPVLVKRWLMGVGVLMPLQQMQAHAQCRQKCGQPKNRSQQPRPAQSAK